MCKQGAKKIVTGIYGGSFNPIHIGHTGMATELVRQRLVDEMWLIVSPQNPLKDNGLWDDNLRLELSRIAVKSCNDVKVSDIEFGLPRPNYMITTLESLSSTFPDREFVLVIGMDNWNCFHLLATMNKDTVNNCKQVFCGHIFSVLLGIPLWWNC